MANVASPVVLLVIWNAPPIVLMCLLNDTYYCPARHIYLLYVYLIYAITSQASTYSTKKYLLQCCKRRLAVQSPQTHFRHTARKHITVNPKMCFKTLLFLYNNNVLSFFVFSDHFFSKIFLKKSNSLFWWKTKHDVIADTKTNTLIIIVK